jgi:hypothetical protein
MGPSARAGRPSRGGPYLAARARVREPRPARLAVRLPARRDRAGVDFTLGLRRLFTVFACFRCPSVAPSFFARRRARFQSLCASDACLRARFASRLASFRRLRARRSSSFARRTPCWATSACSLARSMISAESSFPGEESSAAGISLPVFFMTCLRSEPPVSHKPRVLATVAERSRRKASRGRPGSRFRYTLCVRRVTRSGRCLAQLPTSMRHCAQLPNGSSPPGAASAAAQASQAQSVHLAVKLDQRVADARTRLARTQAKTTGDPLLEGTQKN